MAQNYRWALALITCVVAAPAALASYPPWYPRKTEPPVYPPALVSAAWLAAHLADPGVNIVDARAPEPFERAHFPHALAFDAAAAAPEPGTLAARLGQAGLSDRGTVVCYSDAQDPCAAGRMFWLLELAGHRDVRVLNGGLEAWKSAGHPLERGRPPVRPARFAAAPDTARIADFAYVLAAFGRPGHTLMDWRPFEAWGTGHIPYSLPFPMEKLVRSDGQMLEGPGMRPFFETFGPRANDYVEMSDEFITCGDGRGRETQVHPYLAARLAGLRRVRCYPEGFSGWRTHPEAPIVRIIEAAEIKQRLGLVWGKERTAPGPDRVLIVDLRGPADFATGHLPGAVWLPSNAFEPAFDDTVARLRPGADRGRLPVIFYCYGPDCVRSRSCMSVAAQHGYRNLLWFRDGVNAWLAAGRTLVK